MLTETGTTPREQLNAERWAQELRDEFSLSLGHDCPFAVVASLDQHGAERVTVAGVVLTAEKRGWPIVRVREYVSARLASPYKFSEPFQWFEYPGELCAFIGWMRRERFANDIDGFDDWLDYFPGKMWKWTVEFIEFKATEKP